MSHSVLRFTNSLFSQPLLMTQDACTEVVSYLDKRNAASLKDLSEIATTKADFGGDFKVSSEFDNISGVGVIPITGGISTYKTGLETICPTTSYQGIIEHATTLSKDPSIHTVVLNVRSGGGQAHKAFEQARQLKEIVESSGKKLISYVDELSASAAYILTSVASEVVINNSASAGSIGVLIQLQNDNKAYENAGVKRQWVTSSDGKIPFDKEGEFREEFIKDLEDNVAELYEDFIDHVATFRGMDKSVIRETNAGVFTAEKALSLGLVDRIMETQEFHKYLMDMSENSAIKPTTTAPTVQSEGVNVNQHKKGGQMSTTNGEGKAELSIPTVDAELATKLAEMEATLAAQTAQLKAYQAKELNASKIAMSEELSKFSFASDQQEPLLTFMMSEEVSEESKQLMNSVLENAQLSITEITETAASDIAAAELATKEAKEEVIKVKEDFGKQESLQGEVDKTELTHTAQSGSDRTAQLRAKVNAKLKSK